jgi:hypothetical protein
VLKSGRSELSIKHEEQVFSENDASFLNALKSRRNTRDELVDPRHFISVSCAQETKRTSEPGIVEQLYEDYKANLEQEHKVEMTMLQ